MMCALLQGPSCRGHTGRGAWIAAAQVFPTTAWGDSTHGRRCRPFEMPELRPLAQLRCKTYVLLRHV